MAVTFNHHVSRIPADGRPASGVSAGPVISTPAAVEEIDSEGPANGWYWLNNVGANRPIGGSFAGESLVAVLEIPQDHAIRWEFNRIGDVFRFKQRSTGRYVESHPGVVLTSDGTKTSTGVWASDASIRDDRTEVNVWHLADHGRANGLGERRRTRNCFVGATVDGSSDWVTERDADGTRLRNRLSGRYLDAHEVNSFRVVTRPRQSNATQIFDIEVIGGIYAIKHETGFWLDAFDNVSRDAIKVAGRFDPTQLWAVVERFDLQFTLQQSSNGRFLSVPDRDLVSGETVIANTTPNDETDFQRFTINRAEPAD